MAERMSYGEFNIYAEVVERRVRTSATGTGRHVFDVTMRELGAYASVSQEAREDVSRGKAQEAEEAYLRKWQEGSLRDTVGLGMGVRALFRPFIKDLLEERFVPDPPQLGAPEVVEVELSAEKDLVIGLILPEGTYDATSSSFDNRADPPVWLFAEANQHGDYIQPRAPGQCFSQYQVMEISDSAGAYWTPRKQR